MTETMLTPARLWKGMTSEQRMKAEVDRALKTGDSIGGVFEVVAHNVPPGLGTYANWDERLDGILAQAVMSVQAVKAVEIGRGVTAAESLGSEVHDAIGYAEARENGIAMTIKIMQQRRVGDKCVGIRNLHLRF